MPYCLNDLIKKLANRITPISDEVHLAINLQCHSLSAVNSVPSCLTPGFDSLLFFLRFSGLYNKFNFNDQTVLTCCYRLINLSFICH